MKNVILFLGLLFVISCTKTETPSTPPPVTIAQEEPIKFSISPDISSNNYSLNKDTFDLIILINSKKKFSKKFFCLIKKNFVSRSK